MLSLKTSTGCMWNEVLGYLLIASTGLLIMAFVTIDGSLGISMLTMTMYVTGTAALSIGAKSPSRLVASLALLSLGATSFILDYGMWPVMIALASAAPVIAAGSNLPLVLAGLSTPLALTVELSPLDYKWYLLSLYIASLGAVAVLKTGRMHTGLLALAALIPILWPGIPGIVAGIASLFTFIYIAGIRGRKTCIFSIDNPTLVSGLAVTASGLAISIVLNLEDIYGKAIIAAGLVVLATAFLKPVGQQASEEQC